jgi:hypothetical protein
MALAFVKLLVDHIDFPVKTDGSPHGAEFYMTRLDTGEAIEHFASLDQNKVIQGGEQCGHNGETHFQRNEPQIKALLPAGKPNDPASYDGITCTGLFNEKGVITGFLPNRVSPRGKTMSW